VRFSHAHIRFHGRIRLRFSLSNPIGVGRHCGGTCTVSRPGGSATASSSSHSPRAAILVFDLQVDATLQFKQFSSAADLPKTTPNEGV
jgi:hypothetical protein